MVKVWEKRILARPVYPHFEADVLVSLYNQLITVGADFLLESCVSPHMERQGLPGVVAIMAPD